MSLRACVLGSTNVDLVVRVPALPSPGQTVTSHSWRREPGGKGANQAVALTRLGAHVRFVSAVGSDEPGAWSLDHLRAEGLSVADVRVVPGSSGQAVVLVDDTGENCIVVTPGANASVVAPVDIDADVLLLSLEVPLAVVAATAAAARAAGVPVVLNAAPATALPSTLLDVVDVLVVNEGEWEALGRPVRDGLVVTLGAAGCRVHADGALHLIPAVPVDVVDTTGAGDCFAATLAFGVGSGRALPDAAALAVRAAALSVTRAGARGGLPQGAQLLA